MSVCRLHVMRTPLPTAPISKVLLHAHVLWDFVLRTEPKKNVLVSTETNHILLVDDCQHTFSFTIFEEKCCEFNPTLYIHSLEHYEF